ncbi:MAG: sensor histidine kinase, partial [Anaeromyxobacteraceae bacterium]|nr:sensor histidine kinase [Anaeromyxobacteraceae bacterium]
GARGDALARMAAMVAHEVRNPLGIIRGAAELVRARASERLEAVDQGALQDVLDEVQRLNRLTEDFLDLAREPRLELVSVDLGHLVEEAAAAWGTPGHRWR